MLSIVHVFISLLVLVFSAGAFAQTRTIGVPGIAHFTRTDYQAGTQNWAIGQSNKGLIYFGNNKGLLEYDGSEWHLYPLPNFTILRSFAFGSHNILYVGGQSEFGFFSQQTFGSLVYQSLLGHIPPAMREFEDVWKVLIHDSGVFFCSEKAVYLWKNQEIEVIQPPGGRFENFFEVNDRLYFQDKSKGLFRYVNSTLQPIEVGALTSNDRIVAMLPHTESNILVVTSSKGLFVLIDEDLKPVPGVLSQFAAEHQAYCAVKLSEGGYAIGTAQKGVVISNADGQPIFYVNSENGLNNNTVLSIFQDAQRNLWMGLDNGIGYVEINSPFSYIGTESAITGTGYTSLIHEGYLYLGTNQGLYKGAWNASETDREELKFSLVTSGLGQVWNMNPLGKSVVVSQHKGASMLEGGKLYPLSEIQGAWKFMELNAKPGFALEGTYSGLVLYRTDPKAPGGWAMVKKLEGFDESARVFEEDGDGHIWVSHAYKGLYKLRLSANGEQIEKITEYSASQGLPAALFINVSKIHNELVFTTPVGIYRYNRLADRFEVHADFSAIFGEDRNVHRLLEDGSGNVWFSIDKEFGVLKFNDDGELNKLKLLYFNQLQESLVDGFEHVYARNDSTVFIGTEKGFVHFNPAHQPNIGFPFGVMIRRVTSITENDSVLYWGHSLPGNEIIPEYHYKLNDFRFDFTAPYFEENSRMLYRYKLDGFDKDWSEWSSRTEKEYTNLSQGEYHFTVQARNAYGQMSNEAVFSFRVLPPWWSTIYAKAIYVLLSIVALIAFFSYVSRREKKKTEAFKEEQTLKLITKEAEFKKEVEKSEEEVASLRNEKMQAEINHKTSQLASTTMHLVQKTEMLIKLKDDLTKITGEAPGDVKRKINQITRHIESDIQLDNNWDQFEKYFDQVHENFFSRLRQKHPELTPKDQKLCAYLRMNLSTKEIAPLLNISVRGVEISRYRVRKKLGIESDTNLVEFVMDI